MAIFKSKDNAYNTNLFESAHVFAEVDDKEGLFSISLVNSKDKDKIVFTGPKNQTYGVFNYITNFWYSDSKKVLPEPRKFTIEELNNDFEIIMIGSHESGEFALYRISGNVVMFIHEEDGKLSDSSKQTRYSDIAYEHGKKAILKVITPLINPELREDFVNYISGDLSLDEFKTKIEKIVLTT